MNREQRQQTSIIRRATQLQERAILEKKKIMVRAAQQTIVDIKRLRKSFFSLNFYQHDAGQWDEPVQELLPGKKYKIVLACSSSPSIRVINQQEIPLEEEFDIHFKCIPTANIPVHIAFEDIKAHYREDFCTGEWYIEMPEHLPSCQLTFKVFYSGAEKRSILAASHTLAIQSDGSLEDEELIYTYQLAVRPPDTTAIMVVAPQADAANSRAFTVRGWSSLKPLREHANSPKIVSVAQLMQRQDVPRKILGKIRMFSEKALPDCKAWLQALYALYQERLSLVIIDMTDLEIPWEMFELADWQYLGTMIRVARWLAPDNSQHYPLLIQENKPYEGSAIAYIDTALGERQTARERIALEKSGQVYAAISYLEEQLYADLTHIGLIYVGCHGELGSSLQKLQPDQLAASELAMIDTHPDPRPAALFNACESARVLKDEYGDSSFVEVLLQRCVSGFIGTLGRVGTEFASYIAWRILQQAQEANPRPITEVLRQLREEAVQNYRTHISVSGDLKKKYEYEALYTFMYVYYGNPLACLRLRPQSEEESI